MARPVLYQRDKSDSSINKENIESDFMDLKANVIDVGACVLCGACEYACPENLITIDDTKPQKEANVLRIAMHASGSVLEHSYMRTFETTTQNRLVII